MNSESGGNQDGVNQFIMEELRAEQVFVYHGRYKDIVEWNENIDEDDVKVSLHKINAEEKLGYAEEDINKRVDEIRMEFYVDPNDLPQLLAE